MDFTGLMFGLMQRVVFFFYLTYLCIYLFLATLGLHCFAQASFSSGKQQLLLVAVRRLLIAVVSLVADHRL